ncbi:MAG: glycosyltransferase family 39 protein [Anaerolineae bacterium]
MSARTRNRPLLLALVLLLIAASRAFRLDATVTEVTVDEVWSVWQGLGTPDQIIQWTPYDWTPGYYLTLGAWRALVGLHPVALRWLSLLAFVIGAAALYRVARRLRGDGMIAMLAYAAFGYLIFMSTELRGYVLLLALYPLAIWLALRYFDRTNIQRAIPLAVTMAAMVYCSMTSIPALAALALFTLIVRPRAVWRWVLPVGLSIMLALPALIPKLSVAVTRTQATSGIVLSPFFVALSDMFLRWSGSAPLVWLALLLAAAVLSLRAPRRRVAIALLVWSLIPAALYVSNPVLGFFNVRYAWWVMPGIALLLDFGLAALPLLARGAVAVVFGTLALLPIPLDQYQLIQPPLAVAFDWLTEKAQPGDVVLIDPDCVRRTGSVRTTAASISCRADLCRSAG